MTKTKPTKDALLRAETRVNELIGRNVRLALWNELTPEKRDELGRAYSRRDALYAAFHGITLEAARNHYAMLLMENA